MCVPAPESCDASTDIARSRSDMFRRSLPKAATASCTPRHSARRTEQPRASSLPLQPLEPVGETDALGWVACGWASLRVRRGHSAHLREVIIPFVTGESFVNRNSLQDSGLDL